jgi:hypothetical protein
MAAEVVVGVGVNVGVLVGVSVNVGVGVGVLVDVSVTVGVGVGVLVDVSVTVGVVVGVFVGVSVNVGVGVGVLVDVIVGVGVGVGAGAAQHSMIVAIAELLKGQGCGNPETNMNDVGVPTLLLLQIALLKVPATEKSVFVDALVTQS